MLSHDGCWGQSGGHIICPDVHDHQSLPGHPVEPPCVLLQAPPEESAGVDVCRRQVWNVLLNTPAHGGCEQYSILDGVVTRQALYARGLQILWRCFQLLGRQLRLRHAAEQNLETLKRENVLLKRKADEALQATASFAKDISVGPSCFKSEKKKCVSSTDK
ncbi:hypothetical protein JOQ06_023238 [Pogonophryne albipinna]|uniref:Uncharacterized protein n=1 Tax=Pogonophryne albipinna TaxID=1090488 RepID=A0AAD6FTP0_9TELE|nr:hypothetical protein JOQ06_023238 [Pogonophryne albipinna]